MIRNMQRKPKKNSAETGARPGTEQTERQDDSEFIIPNPILLLILVGILLIFGQSSALSPFIYALF